MSRGIWGCEEGLQNQQLLSEKKQMECHLYPYSTLQNNTSDLKGQKPFHLEEKILGHIPKSLHENEK